MFVKDYSVHDYLTRYALLGGEKRILNAGSGKARYGANCVNVDIQRDQGADVVCDLHDLPSSSAAFDAIVCNAVLQYCHNPLRVAQEFLRVLRPGGYLFVDAPWVQPTCPDTPDRFRFSHDALRSIFADFEILELGPSIRPGSAFKMLGVRIARTLTSSKLVNYVLGKAAAVILCPFSWISTTNPNQTAGAFYLIGRKV